MVAGSGPALRTSSRHTKSSGPALAHVEVTAQYRSSAKAPVSTSSYSGSRRLRRPVGLEQVVVGKGGLRVVVSRHWSQEDVGVAIEEPPVVLHILAVVALARPLGP